MPRRVVYYIKRKELMEMMLYFNEQLFYMFTHYIIWVLYFGLPILFIAWMFSLATFPFGSSVVSYKYK